MRFKELIISNKTYKNSKEIENILNKNGFDWLVDSELDDAKIEITNNTIIWNEGTYWTGNWKYGIWKNGIFYGKWLSGIFENGEFKGEWIDGIKLD
jgi:hypothetical protein